MKFLDFRTHCFCLQRIRLKTKQLYSTCWWS